MIRQFGAVDLLYLAGALRWTVALTLAGFVRDGTANVYTAPYRIDLDR